MIPNNEVVRGALRSARVAAQHQMGIFEDAGSTWHEEPMTELFLGAAAPVVKFAMFSHHQEAATGADWLWWWIDDSGEAFGMLVQAKRLLRRSAGWDIDFDYNRGEQREALVETGLELRVAPMYALYLGTSMSRAGAFCRDHPHHEPCEWCAQATVSLVPALVTQSAVGHDTQVSLALEASLPVELIADANYTVAPVWDSNLKDIDPDLGRFLHEPQTGARRVAQLVFERITKIRMGQFSGPSDMCVERGSEPIYSQLPDDYGHFSRMYYPEIFDGLRHEAPDYVFDVLADQEVPEAISNRVAGIAVFSC